MDPRLQQEKPPVERKAPMREWKKTALLTVGVIILAVWVGGILQDANAAKFVTGGFLVVCLVWGFVIMTRGKDAGTDGHGRKEYDQNPDNFRW